MKMSFIAEHRIKTHIPLFVKDHQNLWVLLVRAYSSGWLIQLPCLSKLIKPWFITWINGVTNPSYTSNLRGLDHTSTDHDHKYLMNLYQASIHFTITIGSSRSHRLSLIHIHSFTTHKAFMHELWTHSKHSNHYLSLTKRDIPNLLVHQLLNSKLLSNTSRY